MLLKAVSRLAMQQTCCGLQQYKDPINTSDFWHASASSASALCDTDLKRRCMLLDANLLMGRCLTFSIICLH